MLNPGVKSGSVPATEDLGPSLLQWLQRMRGHIKGVMQCGHWIALALDG